MPTQLIQINGHGRRKAETAPAMSHQRKPEMSPAEYAKAYLSNRREDLVLRLGSVERSQRRREGGQPPAPAGRPIDGGSDEALDRLAEITRGELSRVDHAMHRLDSGHYGQCERCRSPIGESRLRVVPETTLCTRCAAARCPG
jgi:RNA polymerase-binding transcription factor DksA